MGRQARILVVDDEETWRSVLTEALEDEGFRVDAAASTREAIRRLAETFYHLLVLDIRMEESDESNVEGMQLLRELVMDQHLGPALKIVMLSAHGTKKQMREAFNLMKVSDFISKHDYSDQMFTEQLQSILDHEVLINLGLEIHWKQVGGPEQLLHNLELAGRRIKRNDSSLPLLAEELEDLLCRLFFDAQSILVRPLSSGLSGSSVLLVQPVYTGGAGQPRVVKVGDHRQIELEYRNYREHVEKFIGGGRATSIPVNGLRRTPRLGGIIYSLLGAASERMESFGHFYARSAAEQSCQVLDRLFFETCVEWYRNPGDRLLVDLTEEYQQSLGFTPDKLDHALSEGLKSVHGKQKIHFSLLGEERAFTNPVFAMRNFRFEETTHRCRTHGDLNETNVLVDELGHSWLIDFDSTGVGHIFRDVAEMDAVVRFKLLEADEATLEERLRMEEALCSARRFAEVDQLPARFETTNPALARAYATAVHLRGIARRLVLHNDDINEFYIAGFYYALNMIRFYHLPAVQRQHALLSASLLADRLS